MTLKNRAHDILIRRSGCAAVVALLWATGLVAQAADQPELLVNPGFEEIASGQPAGWEAGRTTDLSVKSVNNLWVSAALRDPC